jgi:hypothetical protein
MTTAELLRQARALIEDKRRWTYGVYARDRYSRHVWPDSEHAVRWCALGALRRVERAWSLPFNACIRALDKACLELYADCSVEDVNDKLGHDAVLAMYNHAIELSEESAP